MDDPQLALQVWPLNRTAAVLGEELVQGNNQHPWCRVRVAFQAGLAL